MSKKWYPVINYETCIECGVCIKMCPHNVYDKNRLQPTVINPDGCIDKCKYCANHCPTESIEYVGDVVKVTECGCKNDSECNCKEDECQGENECECGCHDNPECDCHEEKCECENTCGCGCEEKK
ncbi:MAG: 4Fe-4S binding protein [Candidatus Izemoplasmatales bacterium]|nr:4Fe-4S binding protein [Candidatus Izemoplasmatales bacterium]MDD3864971.1 4Fe-4S binding protein [Candidatus Izemoplasmatales bacterium]